MPRARFLIVLLGVLLASGGCPTEEADDDSNPGDDDSMDDDAVDDDDTTGDDDTGDDDSADDDSSEDPNLCSFPDPLAAEILLTEQYVPGTPSGEWSPFISAFVGDNPDPEHFTVIAEEGECRYLRWHNGLCDPPCDADQECNVDDICVPQRLGVSGGTLTVTVAGDTFEMEPTEGYPGHYWPQEDLPDDLFEQGDPITAALSGDVFPSVALDARGVMSMDAELAEQGLTMGYAQDATITWTAGTDPDACVEVYLVQQGPLMHGDIPEEIIWCIGQDDGSLVIPQTLVEMFPIGDPEACDGDEDWFCVQSTLSRFIRDTVVTVPGPAELQVKSEVRFLHQQAR